MTQITAFRYVSGVAAAVLLLALPANAQDVNLVPTDPIIQGAAQEALSELQGVDQEAVADLPDALTTSDAPVLSATTSIIFALFYGRVSVDVHTDPYSRCQFSEDIWGLGGAGGSSVGFMYTAYDNWDAFFANVTAYHIQGIADGGGIIQVNWFNSSGVPVGQFNGAMAGAGGLEGGGGGTWNC